MKTISLYLAVMSILVVSACSSKPGHESGDEEVICTAIRNFLLKKHDAAVLTPSEERDLEESSWPEVFCETDGMLDSPKEWGDVKVWKEKKGHYRFSCVCPRHGETFVDCTTMEAHVSPDGKVYIDHVVWDAE